MKAPTIRQYVSEERQPVYIALSELNLYKHEQAGRFRAAVERQKRSLGIGMNKAPVILPECESIPGVPKRVYDDMVMWVQHMGDGFNRMI